MKFIHHPDGKIIIDGRLFTLDEFRLVAPFYKLPKNAQSRVYENNVKHYIVCGKSRKMLPLVDKELDSYISKVPELLYLLSQYDQQMLSLFINEQKKNIHNSV